ncbi:hypothetical protein Hanom_Chr17g01568571 [Helianthus anomalus]
MHLRNADDDPLVIKVILPQDSLDDQVQVYEKNKRKYFQPRSFPTDWTADIGGDGRFLGHIVSILKRYEGESGQCRQYSRCKLTKHVGAKYRRGGGGGGVMNFSLSSGIYVVFV